MGTSGRGTDSPGNRRSFLRLLLDADVHLDAAQALRLRGFDVVSVLELGRQTVDDASQLAMAASENRCLVTFNVRHFVALHRHWQQLGRRHSGIVVGPQLPARLFIRRCLVLLSGFSREMLDDQLLWLPGAEDDVAGRRGGARRG